MTPRCAGRRPRLERKERAVLAEQRWRARGLSTRLLPPLGQGQRREIPVMVKATEFGSATTAGHRACWDPSSASGLRKNTPAWCWTADCWTRRTTALLPRHSRGTRTHGRPLLGGTVIGASASAAAPSAAAIGRSFRSQGLPQSRGRAGEEDRRPWSLPDGQVLAGCRRRGHHGIAATTACVATDCSGPAAGPPGQQGSVVGTRAPLACCAVVESAATAQGDRRMAKKIHRGRRRPCRLIPPPRRLGRALTRSLDLTRRIRLAASYCLRCPPRLVRCGARGRASLRPAPHREAVAARPVGRYVDGSGVRTDASSSFRLAFSLLARR